MKLDKETVVKHQFWFMLGSFVLVWLIAVLWLKVAAGGPIKEAEKKYKDSKGKLDKAKQSPKNPNTFCPPWREYGKVFDGHKRVIWGKAWDLQKGMYDWPFSYLVNTPQTEISQDDREKFKRDLYPGEIKKLQDDIPGLLGPVELAGGFDAVFKPQKWTDAPSREECWLTQEDYWVKRELLYVVSGAVALQAYMYRDEIDQKKEPQPADVIARHRFRNLNWEITLLVKKDKDKGLVVSADSILKNVHPGGRTQVMASAKGDGIVFNVQQGKTYQRFELKGEPVPSEKSVTFGSDYLLRGIDWTDSKQPVYMSQAFDWQTCPIRRIEAIDVGQQSCRTYTTVLKANDTLAKLDTPKDAPAESDPSKEAANAPASGTPGGMSGGSPPGGMAGGPPGGMAGGGNMMGPNGMSRGAAAANVNSTPNNSINRNRYLQAPKEGTETEKPSRHLPLAIQVIVDQSHMHDLLLAMANSRLRIEITQVEFHRLREALKPQADSDKRGGTETLRTGAVFMPPGMGDMYRRGSRGGMPMRPPGSGGTPPNLGSPSSPPGAMGSQAMMMMMARGGRGSRPNPGIVMPTGMPRNPGGNVPPNTAAAAAKKTGPSQDAENLVEMTVYGIATLYRYPDPPKTDEQGGQPAPPVPPAPATATPSPAKPR